MHVVQDATGEVASGKGPVSLGRAEFFLELLGLRRNFTPLDPCKYEVHLQVDGFPIKALSVSLQ